MKHLSWALILACLSCHNPADRQMEQSLQSLLDRKEYFKLKSTLAFNGDRLSPEKRLYFQAFVDNVFNRNNSSIEHIEVLLKQYGPLLPDSIRADLLGLKADNEFKTFQYAKAAATDNELIAHYRQVVDSNGYENIKNTELINHALANILPQQAAIHDNTTIPWTRDGIGLMEIPVRCHDSTYQGIFDTGANISCITTSYARRLGIRMLDVSYNVNSATGITVKSALGIADSLRIGNIILQHVVFQVMPDEVLYLAPLHFSINIIIGYPVISQLKEVHILRNGTMTIPLQPAGSGLGNLALDGLDPVVSGVVEGDTLCFKFDSGAGTTDLNDIYFNKHKKYILEHGKEKTTREGGAGGYVTRKTYSLDSFQLFIGTKAVTLTKVPVHIDPGSESASKFYGNLGQDLVSKFNEMTLNFESMYIDFR